jgi:acyl carrier protein
MKSNIIRIVKDILSENDFDLNVEITDDTNLRDLGLTSFDLATLTVMIEDEFNVDVFEEGIVLTIGEIVAVLNKKG